MWKVIYNVLVYVALPFFVFFALFKRKLRRNIGERLFNSTKATPVKNALWIHAASIGEAVIAETLINFLRKNKRELNLEFVVTTNTFYTKDLLLRKFNNAINIYSLPLDLGLAIDRFIDGSTFKAIIIVETEIWPNLIWTAKKKGYTCCHLKRQDIGQDTPQLQEVFFFSERCLIRYRYGDGTIRGT